MEKPVDVERGAAKAKRSWPMWKKLAVAGTILLVIIALAVGLGVGLTRNKGDDSDDDSSNDNGSGDDSNTTPAAVNGPNRTSTWRPKAKTTWQIVLKDPIDVTDGSAVSPDVEVYDLDMADNDADTFKALQDAGKKVICYFSGGSYEEWRDDAKDFDESDLGKPLDGWPGERWLKLSSDNVHNIMKKRVKLAWSKGCDAIDPDNVDGYQNDNGLGLTTQDSIDFMHFLYDEAKQYNMSIGLKNAGDIIPNVIDITDFSVNEQCVQEEECETFSAYIKAGKPVFNIEYPAGAPKDISDSAIKDICSRKGKSAGADGFSTVMKDMDLDGGVQYCDGKVYDTKLSS